MLVCPKLSRTAGALLAAAAIAVCAAPLAAQTFDGAAKVLTMTGRVSVLRNNSEWALNPGSVVKEREMIVTGSDGYGEFQLADGSTFQVFQNSKVIFHDVPGAENLLNVVIGWVKIKVQHQNGPNHKRVTTQTAVISVRGTVFDVKVEDDGDTTFVSVDEGVVNVLHALNGSETELRAGESTTVYRNQRLARAGVKGAVGQAVLRQAAQAVYDVLYRRSTNGPTGPTTAPAGGDQGDKGKSGSTAPPPPPPAPPAPQ
jgi:hypothetical protein